jgi:hypothetical protein
LINAPNFEIHSKKPDESGTEPNRDDLFEFKRIILQNLVRRLYEAAKKEKLIPEDDEPIGIESDKEKFSYGQAFKNAITAFIANILKHKNNHPGNQDEYNNSKDNQKKKDKNKTRKKITDLYRRAVAEQVKKEINLDDLENEKKTLQKEAVLSVEATQDLVKIFVGSSIAAIVLASFDLFPKAYLIDRILPVLIAVIPPAFKSISFEIKKSKVKEYEATRKDTEYYKYDYDTSTLQSELEDVLRYLRKNCYKSYKVVFIIDELDKIDRKDVLDAIKSLKSLFNQASAIFILITDDEFLHELLKTSSDRGKEYTLFTQKLFLKRPSFYEIRRFMDYIVENNPSNYHAIRYLFEWNSIPINSDKTIKDFLGIVVPSDAQLFKIRDATIRKPSENQDIISIEVNKKSVYRIEKNSPFDTSLVESSNNDIKYDFAVMNYKNNGKDYVDVYAKSNQYKLFQNYLCYLSRSDFFDLYNVIRDHIVSYDGTLPALSIKLEQKQETQAKLQEIIGDVYSKKEYPRPSDWHKNDRLLNLMYDLVTNLVDIGPTILSMKILNEPTFRMTFLDKNNNVVYTIPAKPKGTDKNDLTSYMPATDRTTDLTEVEEDALRVLIDKLKEKKFLNLIGSPDDNTKEKTEKYEVRGMVDETPAKTKTYTKEEHAFLDEYHKLRSLIFQYSNTYNRYAKNSYHDPFDMASEDIIVLDSLEELVKPVVSSQILSSYLDKFNSTYKAIKDSVSPPIYNRESLEEETRMLSQALNEISRNFVLLVKQMVKRREENFIVRNASVENLQDLLEPPQDFHLDIFSVPNLIIESKPDDIIQFKFFIMQNPSSKLKWLVNENSRGTYNFLLVDIGEKIVYPSPRNNAISGNIIVGDVVSTNTIIAHGTSPTRFGPAVERVKATEISKLHDYHNATDYVFSFLDSVKRFQKQSAEFAKEWIEEADKLIEQGLYDEAIEKCNRSLNDPDLYNSRGFKTQGFAYSLKGDYRKALDSFYDVLRTIDPTDYIALLNKRIAENKTLTKLGGLHKTFVEARIEKLDYLTKNYPTITKETLVNDIFSKLFLIKSCEVASGNIRQAITVLEIVDLIKISDYPEAYFIPKILKSLKDRNFITITEEMWNLSTTFKVTFVGIKAAVEYSEGRYENFGILSPEDVDRLTPAFLKIINEEVNGEPKAAYEKLTNQIKGISDNGILFLIHELNSTGKIQFGVEDVLR